MNTTPSGYASRADAIAGCGPVVAQLRAQGYTAWIAEGAPHVMHAHRINDNGTANYVEITCDGGDWAGYVAAFSQAELTPDDYSPTGQRIHYCHSEPHITSDSWHYSESAVLAAA